MKAPAFCGGLCMPGDIVSRGTGIYIFYNGISNLRISNILWEGVGDAHEKPRDKRLHATLMGVSL